MVVELCEANEIALYVAQLEENAIDVVTYPCLDRCEACVWRAYAYVDGGLLESDSARELLDAIIRRKQTQPSHW